MLALKMIAAAAVVALQIVAGAHAEELLFWGPNPSQPTTDAYRAAFDQYQKENPGITIRMDVFPWTNVIDKLEAAHLSGKTPDLVRLDTSSIATAAGKGILQQLDGLIDAKFFDEFVGPSLLPYTLQGKHYGLPVDVNTRMIVYNKEHFASAGITSEPKTFEEFIDIAKKLTRDGHFGYAMGSKQGINLILGFAPFLYAAGGDFLTPDMTKCVLDRPEGIAAIKFFEDLMVKAKVTPPGELERDRGQTASLFDNGSTSMFQGGLWDIDRLKTAAPNVKYGMMMFPGSKNPSGDVIAGWGLVITANSKAKEATAKLLRWMLDPVNAKYNVPVVESLPGNKQALTNDRFKGPLYDVGREQIRNSQAFPLTTKWLDLTKPMSEQLQLVLLGQSSPADAAKNACVEINRILALN